VLTLLFYRPVTQVVAGERFLAACAATLGTTVDAGRYRQAEWCDPATGARAIIDLGDPPFTHDAVVEERHYDDWERLPLRCQVTLDGPHWRLVEVTRWLAELLRWHPAIGVLDTEDTGVDGVNGPGPLDRLRLLASWERLRDSFQALRQGVLRLDRRRSILLWRYLREMAMARERFPALHWPAVVLLGRDEAVWLVMLLADGPGDIVLPPVDLVVVRRDGGPPGLLPADELLIAGGGGEALTVAGVHRIRRDAAVERCLSDSHLLPAAAYRLLGDGDWRD
jgi:hypothetical protein